ncbi:MAG: thioredoxin domain-containing protein [Candidatus Aenigmarchaeota archaeon]|nr:thioredoxin domain-containing protein [Candidatus Aenigmarchaeota archaeon]
MKKSHIAGIVIVVILLLVAGALMSGKKYTPTGKYLDKTFKGGADAKVVVVKYSDFQCPACRAASGISGALVEKYGDKVKFIYKNFPLRSTHPQAQKAAEAAECVKDLGGDYWRYHNLLFENQNALYPANLEQYASQIGVDIDACLDSGAMGGIVESDYQEGVQKGVRATPTFFINSERVQGANQQAVFNAVDKELKKAA